VDAVWRYFRERRPGVRVLGAKTRKAIVARLREGFTVEDLTTAIAGNYLSPYHCGQNDRQTEYHDLELIVRSAENVDRFISFTERAGKPALSQRSQRTAAAAESYLETRGGSDA